MVKGSGFLGGKSKNYARDDGCIGNRKVRTVTFSMLLIAFMCFGLSYWMDNQEQWADAADDDNWLDLCNQACEDTAHAWTMIVAGAFAVIGSAVFAILLFFVDCDDKLGRVAGVGLMIGGLLYLIGYTWLVSLYHDSFENFYDFLTDEQKDRINMMLAAWFGEALLPSAAAILLGIDVFMHLFDNESHRLAFNLLMIGLVCFVAGPCYYTLSEDGDDFTISIGFYPYNSDAYPWIATGYMVLGGFCFIYVFLYVFTCCTCDCKDSKIVRLLMALGLIVGGVLASIGYWIFAGEFTSDNSDDPSKFTLYYVGYTVIVAGFPIMWALDVGLDDVKGN